MPALFVGHGSPMNAIEDNAWTRRLREVGRGLPRPKAVVCVSAHWLAPGVRIGASRRPHTIHDFGGFPQALFDVQYPAPGDPELAGRIAGMLDPALKPVLDEAYGLDHGAWQVLVHLFPDADVPVVQVSLDPRLPGAAHLAIGRMLAPLRDDRVLLLASGNIVHNLRQWNPHDATAPAWATGFRDRVNALIAEGDLAALADYTRLPDATLAVPTPDHYLPLLYTLAAAREGDALTFFNDDVASTLSMTSLLVGEARA